MHMTALIRQYTVECQMGNTWSRYSPLAWKKMTSHINFQTLL